MQGVALRVLHTQMRVASRSGVLEEVAVMESTRRRLMVFYDGNCPLCTESARVTTGLDWMHRLQFVSFRDEGVADAYGLEEVGVERRIYSVIPDTGRAFSGIHTVLQIFLRVPPYWVLVPFIWLSILCGLGQPVYDWIAKRRRVIPIGKCSNGACQIDKPDDRVTNKSVQP